MLEYARQLTDDIEHHARALATGYDAERLYNLRVAMRRLRSMLKHGDSHRASLFRKAWGGFATVTNRARDWDVFLAAARELLDPAAAAEFERLNRAAVQASHAAATNLVRSAHWQANLSSWQSWLERCRGAADNPFPGPGSASAVREKARRALLLALEAEDRRSWHKFRIAVKELRYVVDALLRAEGPDVARERLVEVCKSLQTALGSWHDSVIQLELLDELQPSAVHDTLREILLEHRHARLQAVRELCSGGPVLFELQADQPSGA